MGGKAVLFKSEGAIEGKFSKGAVGRGFGGFRVGKVVSRHS